MPKQPEYVNAAEAGRMTGLSEKTIRRRIKAGQLKVEPGPGNSYAISVKELRKLTGQRPPSMGNLLARLVELEENQERQAGQIQALEQRIEELEQRRAAQAITKPLTRQRPDRGEEEPGAAHQTPASLPPGSIPLIDFCRTYNIAARTLNDHARQGIIDVIDIGEQAARGQPRYWLTPEQQEKLRAQRGL